MPLPAKNNFENKILGTLLISVAVIGFVTTGVFSLINVEKINNGTIPAISFLILVIGFTFYFPSLLEEEKGEVSTMRVCVLIVVLVFATVYIKLGWIAGSFEEFFIDTSWIYILGIAFGTKAFQRYAEIDDENKDKTKAD